MKITQWEFENEFESLLNAARSTDNKETARRFLRGIFAISVFQE